MKFALIAHDNKKADMVAFVSKRLPFFNRKDVGIVTTGTTGKKVKHAGITDVETVNSGPLGGDAEIAAMVVRGERTGVIFLRDPLDKHPHDVDISMLMRLCDVHDIPLATNYRTASILIKWFKQK
jgi:methylglyoxal synthase